MGSYISVFSLCRAIRLAKRIDRYILKSIVTPSTGLPRQSQLINDIVALSKDLILRYCPSFLSTPLCQGVRWEKTWKARPSWRPVKRRVEEYSTLPSAS